MKYVFGEPGIQVIRAMTFTKALFAFDFDGTLVPIVDRPELVNLSEKTEALLSELAGFAPLAIISGRSIADLRRFIRKTPAYLIGNHGLENSFKKDDSLRTAEKTTAAWRKVIDNKWMLEKVDSHLFIEDKAYSLAIHFRHSRNKKRVRATLESLISTLSPKPRLITGKGVFNLVPLGAPHKGFALLKLMAYLDLPGAFYAGDDETDEDVFSLPESEKRLVTLRVGQKKTSSAQYYLKRQTEMNALLSKIIEWFRQNERRTKTGNQKARSTEPRISQSK